MASPPRVELTAEERQLFDTLIAASKQAGFPTTLRCAGGWVRDKLMGRASDDVDIALDDALGSAFAAAVNEHLERSGRDVHSVAVIASNPGQSKHLETARMRVNGLWLDLFGTPRQDAERRDFTINALFYNLTSGEVEDLTGRGLADLAAGVIRTPLPPRRTLLDDPLRALRAVRFAARFGFKLEEQLVAAAAHPEIAMALEQKVSRERVGSEMDGMLGGPDPVAALRLLRQLGLLRAVLGQDLRDEVLVERASTGMEAARLAGVELSREEQRDFVAAVALLSVREESMGGSKGKPIPLASHILRTALKWPGKSADGVGAILATAPRLLEIMQTGLQGGALEGEDSVRVSLGRCVRTLKGSWREGGLLACLLAWPQDAVQAAEGYRGLAAAVEGWGLQRCWEWKPPLNGKRVMELLGVSGKGVGAPMAAIADWQLLHPEGSPQECEAWLTHDWAPRPAQGGAEPAPESDGADETGRV